MTESAALREPIAASWRRATLAGLEPTSALAAMTHADIDRGSALLAAAAPVLEDLAAQLGGTHYSTALIDRDGRVTHRWCGDHGTTRAFDDLGIDVGASLLEEVVGTNAPGTALETRGGITICGDEHFAVPLRRFACYGHPILHPLTRRVEGALNLSAMADETNPLFGPLTARAARDIEQRLLDGSRVSDQQLLAAFQLASRRRRPFVAVGHDLQVSNTLATDLLGTNDLVVLRLLAQDAHDGQTVDLTLESGDGARIVVSRVGGPQGGALLEIAHRRPATAVAVATPRAHRAKPVLVAGPPGSGRSTRARALAVDQPVSTLGTASALLDGPEAWARSFVALTRAGEGTVCIEGLDLLPEELLELVAGHLTSERPPRLVLVSGPATELTGRAAAVAAQCTEHVSLAPLAQRVTELPAIAQELLTGLGTGCHLAPAALQALSGQPWPGNLRELRSVLDHAVAGRNSGAICCEDLPAQYRHAKPARPMAAIERAERDAIVLALRHTDGNKVHAAAELGISRTTLYAKMRALRITSW